MKSIVTYINGLSDGHYHLFDDKTITQSIMAIPRTISHTIGFADVNFDNLSAYKDLEKLYKNYIESDYYNTETIHLCCTGTSPDQIEKVYNTYKNHIVGFGELKCYSFCHNNIKLPFQKDRLQWVKDVLDINKANLPVYIHYYITDDEHYEIMKEILEAYPNTPIILCHLGLRDLTYKSCINKYIKKLMKEYKNLYVDISYNALTYITNLDINLRGFDLSRIIGGTDINPKLLLASNGIGKGAIEYNKLYKLHSMLPDMDANIKKLFNL